MLSIDELNKRNEETTNRINKHRKEKQAIEKATENLGAFIPGFLYPGENVIYPIYPTVTDDLKNLDTVTNLCLAIIKEITTKA
jgi:hypothetical protein